MIFSTGTFCNFLHVFFYQVRNWLVEFIGSFSCLEINIRVLGGTPGYRMFRIKSIVAEPLKVFPWEQIFKVVNIKVFNFLNFVRSTESVEEMNERYSCSKSNKVSNGSNIHFFLNTSRSKKCKSCLTC